MFFHLLSQQCRSCGSKRVLSMPLATCSRAITSVVNANDSHQKRESDEVCRWKRQAEQRLRHGLLFRGFVLKWLREEASEQGEDTVADVDDVRVNNDECFGDAVRSQRTTPSIETSIPQLTTYHLPACCQPVCSPLWLSENTIAGSILFWTLCLRQLATLTQAFQ